MSTTPISKRKDVIAELQQSIDNLGHVIVKLLDVVADRNNKILKLQERCNSLSNGSLCSECDMVNICKYGRKKMSRRK